MTWYMTTQLRVLFLGPLLLTFTKPTILLLRRVAALMRRLLP